MVPAPFSALTGQAQAVELLTWAIAQERIAPAYLFAGPDGVGRSLAARCFVELLLNPNSANPSREPQQRLYQENHPDVLWVEPTYLHQGKQLTASEMAATKLQRQQSRLQIRLGQIRDIARFLSRPPLKAPRSIVVIEQAETMGEAAANALLKTLEEPGQATLILIAPSPDALLPTLVSRCQRIPFTRLTTIQICQVLERAGYSEILSHPQILAMAQGSPGTAIHSWQQLQAIPPELLQVVIQLPQSPREALSRAQMIDRTLDTETQLWLVDYLQQSYWQQQFPPHLLRHLEQARQYLLNYAQPQLVWEVTLLAMVSSR